MATVAISTPAPSPWAPLRVPLFRAFWLASLMSNLGTWVHEIGAGWLMTELSSSPQMVASVRTAMALPILLLAIPAGALADRSDRRRLMLITQFVLLGIAASLATLTRFSMMSAGGLLACTFAMGLAMVVHYPTWQASIPELVPRPQLSRAIALGSISFNLARAIGPAIGGFLIALAGAWIAFAVNAVSFAGVICVLFFWQRDVTESSRGQSFLASMRHGVRYVSRSVVMRHVLIGVIRFVFPASAVWSLLPLIVRRQLEWDADGLGLMVGLIGGGAVMAAYVLPRIQLRWGRDGTIRIGTAALVVSLAAMSQVTTWGALIPITLLFGGGWMMTLTTLNSVAQQTLRKRMRARGMGCYLSTFALAMSGGSATWGFVAQRAGLDHALSLAAMAAAVLMIATYRWRVTTGCAE